MLSMLAILLSAGVATAGSLSTQHSIPSGGHTRTFFYYAPSNYDPSKGMMMYLHGGGGNGSSSAGQGTDFLWQNLADRAGIFTVFPEGKAYSSDPTSHTWNNCKDDTRGAKCQTCTNWDDVQFIRDLISWVKSSYDSKINFTRVYAAGESEGSMMAQRLALEANDVIAAVASIAGNLPVSNDNSGTYKCSGYDAPYKPGTNEAVPILLFKGDADPRIPFGATTADDHQIYAQIDDWCHRPAYNNQCPPMAGYCVNGCDHSFFDSLAFWEWKHGLSSSPTKRVPGTQTITYADTVPNCTDSCPDCDGSYVIRHNIGKVPYPVVVDRAVGGGHHFPGPSADTPDCRIYNGTGWKNRDKLGSLSGFPYIAEEIWAFVSQFTLAD